MNLNHTKTLMQKKLDSVFFDAYAVLVGIDGKEALITSPQVNTDTYFDIASMGKVLVTGTLMLKAISEGRMTLDDTLDQYFKNVPEKKQKITVRQLLTHTSGIIRVDIPKTVTSNGRDAISEYILAVPGAFEPDAKYQYSCSGYILLGFILEKLYNMSLDEIYYTRLKPQLGLTRSKFNIAENEDNAAVTHYRKEAGSCMVADNIVYNMNGVAGNGASFWTVADVRKFILAVLEKSEKLYPEPFFEMAEKNLTPDMDEGRGLGYLIVDEQYRQTGKLFPVGSFGHCGNTGTSFFISRERSLYTILFTNATRYSYMRRDYRSCDYNEIMNMREEIHNAIRSDLLAQGLME